MRRVRLPFSFYAVTGAIQGTLWYTRKADAISQCRALGLARTPTEEQVYKVFKVLVTNSKDALNALNDNFDQLDTQQEFYA